MTDSDTGKTTLMVVDDSRLMRVAARKILKNDFDIIEAADGEEAWETLQQHPEVALVMSDLSMPNLDGLGLLKRIRESDFAQLPVIIVTGAEDDDGSKKTALAAGASDFITKPFESVQLLARAKSQALQKDTQEALQQSEAEKQQLREASQVDPLTGIANKRAFIDHLEENLAYATRHRIELSLILIRIEKYKVLFLRRGKRAAEALTKEIARILGEDRRREDTIGHIALDTFGILLPSANRHGAKRVLAQLEAAIEQAEVSVEGEPVPFKIGFGMCSPDIRPGIRADEVMQLAEAALSASPLANAEPAPAAQEPVHKPAQPLEPLEPLEPEVEVEIEAEAVASLDAVSAIEPVEPEVATPADIQQALNALANRTEPSVEPDALIRGILPLLLTWNNAHGQRYDSLMHALNEALYPTTEEEVDAAPVSTQRSPELAN